MRMDSLERCKGWPIYSEHSIKFGVVIVLVAPIPGIRFALVCSLVATGLVGKVQVRVAERGRHEIN